MCGGHENASQGTQRSMYSNVEECPLNKGAFRSVGNKAHC